MRDDSSEITKLFEGISDHQKMQKLRAKRTKFPDDPIQWLKELEKRLVQTEDKVPAEVWSEFNGLITKQIKTARIVIKNGDDAGLKSTILTLSDNWDRLKRNMDILTLSEKDAQGELERDGGREGGESPTSRPWMMPFAKLLAEETDRAADNEAWEFLANQVDPLVIEIGFNDYEIYADGDKIVALNASTGKEEERKKSTFLKDYYRKARNTGK